MNQALSEERLQDSIAQFAGDPVGFVWYAFPWGEGDLKDQEPDTWQIKLLEDIRDGLEVDFEAVQQHARSSGHGIGKTAIVAWIILWSMSVRPHIAGVVTANTMQQLTKKTWRELAIWHKRLINSHWFEWTATRFQHVDHKETWGFDAVPWTEHNSEAFAGTHAKYVTVIYDEASAIVDIIWEVTEGAMTTDRAMWFAFGNPTRPVGRFRACFGKNKHRWSTATIDSRTCRMTSKEKIKEWEEDHDEDSDFMRVRVRGEFPRFGTANLISSEDVDKGRKLSMALDEYVFFPKAFGVDVARYGGDESVITYRQGRKVHYQRCFYGLNNIQLAARVAEAFKKEGSVGVIFVDEIGVGAGVLDYLRALGLPAIGVNAGAKARNDKLYYNTRAEMWDTMAKWTQLAIDIPDDPTLAEQMSSLEYFYDLKERIQLEKKEDFKKRMPDIGSPDRAESLALTFAQPVTAHLAQDSVEPDDDPDY